MKQLTVLLMLTLFSVWFAGCEKESTAALNTAETEINEMILDDNEEYFEDEFGFIDSESATSEDEFVDFSKESFISKNPEELLDVFKFGRIVNRDSVERFVNIRVEGDTAFVHVETELQGRFVILEKLDDNGDTLVRHMKPLKHFVQKNAVYVKRDNENQHRRRWRMLELSGGVGHSPNNTVSILKIKVVSGLTGQEYIFDNPLENMYELPDNLPVFPMGDEVTVTVTVENTSSNPVLHENGATESVFLHYGMRPRVKRNRHPMPYIGQDNEGNKMYENTWTVNRPALLSYHAVIDVIDNGTIFKADADTYPYNSMTWGFPYRVHPDQGN